MTTLTYKRVGRSDPLLFPSNLWPHLRSPPEQGKKLTFFCLEVVKGLRRWRWDYQRYLIFGIFGIIKALLPDD